MKTNSLILGQAEQYWQNGFVIVPKFVKGALLEQLRQEAERGENIARGLFGLSARRLQPIRNYGLNLEPFREAFDSQQLRRLLAEISPQLYIGVSFKDPMQLTTILFNPRDRYRWTYWHRDWRDRLPLDEIAFHAGTHRRDMFASYSLPLWDDNSLWVVPSSHRREDFAHENLFREVRYMRWSEWDERCLRGHTFDARALKEIQNSYVRTMRNGINIRLCAGDLCIWHQGLWHLGAYDPSAQRATVHDSIGSGAMMRYSIITAGERVNYAST